MNSSISNETFEYSKAAILVESHKELLIDEIEIPRALFGNQVKVKLIYSSICGSQLGEIDAIKGPDKFLPHLLGQWQWEKPCDKMLPDVLQTIL